MARVRLCTAQVDNMPMASDRDQSRHARRLQALFAPLLHRPRPRARTGLIALLIIGFATWHLVFVNLSPPTPSLPSNSLTISSSPRLIILQTIFTPPTTLWSCFMTIFGQGWPERPIYRASIRGHERYAATWGYGYALETQQFVPPQKGVEVPFLNKVHALLRLAQGELATGDRGAEWVL